MIRNVAIITIVLFVCIIAGCHSMEPKENKTIQTKEVKGLTLNYLLDSLHINPIAVSDTDKRYIKEYKNIPDDIRFNFDFPKLQDGSWMLIGRSYGKPCYVVQVKNGKKHGYCFIVDEKTGVVRNIDLYIEGKQNGMSISYNMRGIKDGIFTYKNDEMIDTAYLLYSSGSVWLKRIYSGGRLVRIIEYNQIGQIISDAYQSKDSNVIYNYSSGKLVSKATYKYTYPRENVVVHYDSTEAVIRIDTNRNE